MCCVCPSGGAKLCSQGVGAEGLGSSTATADQKVVGQVRSKEGPSGIQLCGKSSRLKTKKGNLLYALSGVGDDEPCRSCSL